MLTTWIATKLFKAGLSHAHGGVLSTNIRITSSILGVIPHSTTCGFTPCSKFTCQVIRRQLATSRTQPRQAHPQPSYLQLRTNIRNTSQARHPYRALTNEPPDWSINRGPLAMTHVWHVTIISRNRGYWSKHKGKISVSGTTKTT